MYYPSGKRLTRFDRAVYVALPFIMDPVEFGFDR